MQLWQHDNGRFYVLHGERLKRRTSTGTGDRDAAQIFLARFIAEQAAGPLDSDVTVREILETYRDEHSPEVASPDAIKYGVNGLLPHVGDLLPHHLTPPTIKKYARERGASDGTILREIGTLRAALAWAKEHNRLERVPTISAPVETPAPRDRWMTREEADLLKAACTAPHLRIFVILGLMTVPRMGALLEAKLTQVDWKNRIIDYGKGRGNKRRVKVPLNDDAMAALKLAEQISVAGYIIEHNGKPLDTVKKGFAAACERAGIEGVTPHVLRHSGATWMALEAVPMQQIANMLGDSLTITERVYAKYHPAYMRAAADALQGKKNTPKRRTRESALQGKPKPGKAPYR